MTILPPPKYPKMRYYMTLCVDKSKIRNFHKSKMAAKFNLDLKKCHGGTPEDFWIWNLDIPRYHSWKNELSTIFSGSIPNALALYIKVKFEFTKGKFREVPMSYFCCSCALLLLFKPILNLRRPLDFVSVLIYACISIVRLECYLHLWFILLVL